MQHRHVAQRLGPSGNRHFRVAEDYLVGCVCNCLVGRRARPPHRVSLHPAREQRHERYLAGDVRSRDVLQHRTEYEHLHQAGIQLGPLQELTHCPLAKINGTHGPEHRARLRKGSTDPGHYRYPASTRMARHALKVIVRSTILLVPRSGVHAFRPTSIIHAAVTTAVPDLLIIGGGITGAGVARDAALRGLQVTLVERDDIACGTSSRSSRLVHGGVRYLEHGHLRLVFESSRERRILLTTAPHLVRPLSFTWPVYRGTRLPRWKVGAGLALYDALSLFRNVGRHQRLNSTGVLEREAALESNALLGGFAYWDASTDDSRLTLATAVDAAVCGADIRTHTEVLELLRDGSRIVGARVANTLTGEESELRARLVVSTVGPWTDELLGRDPGAVREQQTVRGTKGVHIMLPREAAGNAGALTLIAPADGRVTFALPAGDFSLIGTTDTPTDEHPATVRASQADVAYLLNVVRHFFPGRDTSERDVVSSWAGIRPLAVAGYSDGPSSASREHSIVMHPSGMLVVTGGKLTTYRSMAAEVVDRAGLALGTRLADSGTAERPLPGGDCEPEAERAAAERETGSA